MAILGPHGLDHIQAGHLAVTIRRRTDVTLTLREADKINLPTAWAEFALRYQFCWLVTITFENQHSYDHAFIDFRSFVNKLNTSLHGHKWANHRDRAVYWVCAIEPHKVAGFHVHAILGHPDGHLSEECPAKWTEFCERVYGKSEIGLIRNKAAVYEYVAKQSGKDRPIEISSNLPAVDQRC